MNGKIKPLAEMPQLFPVSAMHDFHLLKRTTLQHICLNIYNKCILSLLYVFMSNSIRLLYSIISRNGMQLS